MWEELSKSYQNQVQNLVRYVSSSLTWHKLTNGSFIGWSTKTNVLLQITKKYKILNMYVESGLCPNIYTKKPGF